MHPAAALLPLLLAGAIARLPAQSFVVVGAPELLDAADALCAHRGKQGLSVERLPYGEGTACTDPEALRRALHERIRAEDQPGYLLLLGDPLGELPLPPLERPGLRTFGIPHGKERVVSDLGYVDVDDDGRPEWACGRLPCRTPQEVRAAARKILAYERTPPDDDGWQRDVALIANSGDFGAVIDALLENAIQELLRDNLAPGDRVCGVVGLKDNPLYAPPEDFLPRVLAALDAGPFAAVYAGHGSTTRFAPVAGHPVLRSADAAKLRSAERTALFAFACHIGAFHRECLGEALLRAEHGPCAVVAASEVSFPYGDVLFAREMLRVLSVADGPLRIGDLVARGKAALLADEPDPYRARAERLARTLGYDAEQCAHLRRYTADLYHLLGDPAMPLRLPRPLEVAAEQAEAGGPLRVRIVCPGDARPRALRVELCVDRGARRDDGAATDVLATATARPSKDGAEVEFAFAALPARGRYVWVRVYGRDGEDCWTGGARIAVRR
ncbi:MAG: C25 family cysteine peptidase [Planctomycetota bacterium]